ncbi:MAG: hypothetical protein WA064_04715 [Candidatus Moraniibacteriota bacterium]
MSIDNQGEYKSGAEEMPKTPDEKATEEILDPGLVLLTKKQELAESATQTEQVIEKNKAELKAAREKLGIAEPEIENAPSIVLAKESLAGANEKLSEIEELTKQNENGREIEKQSPAEVALEKIKLYNFSDQVIGLARALRARNEHELTPIIHPGVASYLYSKASSLEEMIQSKRAKPEEIGQAILEIVGAVDAFGKDVPMTGGVREDSRSLGHVASALENLEESSRDIMIQLGGEEDCNLEDVVGRFKQLVIITEKAKRYATGKMNLFRRYEEN